MAYPWHHSFENRKPGGRKAIVVATLSCSLNSFRTLHSTAMYACPVDGGEGVLTKSEQGAQNANDTDYNILA